MVLLKKRILAFTILAFYLLSPVTSWACTSIIVGKNASVTGRVLFARTDDSAPNGAKKFFVVPAGFYKGGTEYVLRANGASSFKFTFSHDSYKYTAVPDTTRLGIAALGGEAASKDAVPHFDDGFHFAYDACGVNEKGLSVTGTNTTGFRSATETGLTTSGGWWTEHTMAKVLLAEAATCQEALSVIDKIVTEANGFGGMANELIMMADLNEAWIVEAVSRYHYVASRVPDDSFCVIANCMRHQYFDKSDTANYKSNFDPVQYAIDHGFARYQIDENGQKRVNITLTYGQGPQSNTRGANGQYNSNRMWRGMSMFAPSLGLNLLISDDFWGAPTAALATDTGKTYPVFVKPDKKISPMDIAVMQRDRYAGTPFDLTYANQPRNPDGSEIADATTAGYYWPRVIGYYTQQFTHIFEARTPDYPAEIGARFWISMAQAESSVNLPFYGNITDTHPFYKKDITATNGNVIDSYYDNQAFWLFASIGRLARSDRRNYAEPIKNFWHNHELKLFEDQLKVIEPEMLRLYKEVSPEASAKFITDYTIAVSDRTFRAAAKIHDALVAHIATAPNTLFAIPAELLEPTVNDSVLLSPTAADVKAAGDAQSGLGLLTRDDGNIIVSTVDPIKAPTDIPGVYDSSPGVAVEITLKPEQVAAKQTAAKLLYEVELKVNNMDFAVYGGISNFIKKLRLSGEMFDLAGPGSNALISFADALEKGIATVTLTSDSIIITLEYILADGPGESGVYNGKLVVFDGDADGVLNGTIWAWTPNRIITPPSSGGSGGCNAGLGCAAFGLFGMLIFVRKRSK